MPKDFLKMRRKPERHPATPVQPGLTNPDGCEMPAQTGGECKGTGQHPDGKKAGRYWSGRWPSGRVRKSCSSRGEKQAVRTSLKKKKKKSRPFLPRRGQRPTGNTSLLLAAARTLAMRPASGNTRSSGSRGGGTPRAAAGTRSTRYNGI